MGYESGGYEPFLTLNLSIHFRAASLDSSEASCTKGCRLKNQPCNDRHSAMEGKAYVANSTVEIDLARAYLAMIRQLERPVYHLQRAVG